ncbi:MAG: DNA polymerase I [Dehalococcoidales bacterium]|nr:DNA polymerase I [Dehalococcoidales bacterium]
MNKLLVLIDGNALVHRAYHALPPMTVKNTGEPVNAVYGLATMLIKIINDLKPDYLAIGFDRKAPTLRKQLFDEYKANRPATPLDLISQLARARELAEAFNMPVFEMDSYEADDIIGTLSRQARNREIETIIVTGDADAMQLVSPEVKVLYPKPKSTFGDTTLYEKETVKERYGVPPENITDLKALVGDKSDNIPGVSGIGDKTAIKLIQTFGGIDNIYEHLDEVTPVKLREKLQQNEDIARKSKELATIITDMPISLDLNACCLSNYDRQKVVDFFHELDFSKLLSRLPGTETKKGEIKKPECPQFNFDMPVKTQAGYKNVCTAEDLDILVRRLKERGSFAFDTETTGLNPMLAQLVGISLSPEPGEAYYIPVGHIGWEQVQQLPLTQVIKKLKPLFEDYKLAKIAHNGKFDMEVLAEYDIDVNNLACDTMIAAYLLGEKSLGLKALAFNRLETEMTEITELIGSGKNQINMSQVEVSVASKYACADADNTSRLDKLFTKELKEQGLWQLFSEVEMPLVPILMKMERKGIALDTVLLGNMSHRLGGRLLELEDEIYKNAGRRFNINSTQQLSPVLFQELKLPSARKTKSGFSTDVSVLEELRGQHPIIELIIEYRQLTKLKSTYVDALPEMVNSKTRRLHTSFNQTKTTTGRLSSSDPNLQNIPVRGELGKEIRQAFIAPTGYQLLSADYSQIDLRALAHLSQDPELLTTFHNEGDIHTATATRLFSVREDDVTADMRRLAKTVNFGVIYGMSGYGLEQATEFNREEAEKFITAYFEKYPRVKEYMETTKKQARELGYVQTILGRRRAIPEVNSSNRNLREAAERMAINMPVQGTSADIIKVAMVNLDKEMARLKLKSSLLLQVHDELIFEVPNNEMEKMKELAPRVMSHAIELSIPLKVETKVGKNWGQME